MRRYPVTILRPAFVAYHPPLRTRSGCWRSQRRCAAARVTREPLLVLRGGNAFRGESHWHVMPGGTPHLVPLLLQAADPRTVAHPLPDEAVPARFQRCARFEARTVRWSGGIAECRRSHRGHRESESGNARNSDHGHGWSLSFGRFSGLPYVARRRSKVHCVRVTRFRADTLRQTTTAPPH